MSKLVIRIDGGCWIADNLLAAIDGLKKIGLTVEAPSSKSAMTLTDEGEQVVTTETEITKKIRGGVSGSLLMWFPNEQELYLNWDGNSAFFFFSYGDLEEYLSVLGVLATVVLARRGDIVLTVGSEDRIL